MNSEGFPPEFRAGARAITTDFEGVLNDDCLGLHDGSCYGDPIQGSLHSIKHLALRFRLVVFSEKAMVDRPLDNGLTGSDLIWDWLKRHGFESYVSDVTWEKPLAELCIDDNGFRFEVLELGGVQSFIERELH